MRLRLLGATLTIVTTLTACDPPSALSSGHSDAVRYQLPPGTTEVLEGADAIELLALGEPTDGPEATRHATSGFPSLGTFAGRPVVARVALGKEHAATLADALYRAIADGAGELMCFAPHHALRVRRGSRRFDVAICFHCGKLEILSEPGGFVQIDPSRLDWLFEDLLARRAHLRFVGSPRTLQGRWEPVSPTAESPVSQGQDR